MHTLCHPLFAVITALALSSCISPQLVQQTRANIDRAQADAQRLRTRLLTQMEGSKPQEAINDEVDLPYLAGKPVPLAREITLPYALRKGVKTAVMFPEKTVPLNLAAERITLATGIPVKIDPDVYLSASALLPRAQSNDAALNATHVTGGKVDAPLTSAAPNPLLQHIPPGFASLHAVTPFNALAQVEFQPGEIPLNQMLDLIATRLSINWLYDEVRGAIRFYRMLTKIWQLPGAAGEMSFTTAFQGSTVQSSNANATLLPQNTYANSAAKREATHVNELNSIRQSIETLMTRAGSIATNAATGTITLTDTKEAVECADEIITREIHILSRRVLLKLQKIQVLTHDTGQAGIDWNMALTTALSKLPDFKLAAHSPASLAGSHAAGFNLNLLAGTLNNSSALITALSEIGRVQSSTELPMTIRNRQPMSYDIGNAFSYVSAALPATSTVGGTGGVPGLKTSQISTGLKLLIYPNATSKDTVDLTFSIEDSMLKSLDRFDAGTGQQAQSVQLPSIDRQGTTLQTTVRSGSTIVLTGFERFDDQFRRRTLGERMPLLSGGSIAASRQRTTTLIVISAVIQDDI
ncbi:type II and III secretion system protein [Mycoavidus sp. HKI]|uniref:type II and III secretion system protein n=1 Tax=Mycoavidus sp. HKI TaxID=2840467 RepID=UPI001CBF044D|nr:type II and III secretion system protein [Mycoavidus sp. HKI]UAW64737.1 type II and III secretion system protein [Mycoavidus sp. HKI]